MNEAAILAARRNKKIITMSEFEEAVDRVIAGPERTQPRDGHRTRSAARPTTKVATRFVGHFLEQHDQPHKVTIVSRGMAGGYTRYLPDEEVHYRTPQMIKDMLCSALGGHAAEEMIFGEASTGPSDDIEQGHPDRPGDGHALRHEREARAADLRPQRRAGVPRPRNLGDARLQREDR